MAIDYNAGITSIDAGAPDIKYTGDEGPKSPDQMKLEGIMQMASDDANERVLEQIFEQLLEEGFSPEEAAIKAREIFDQRAMATGGRVGYAGGQLVKSSGDGKRPGYAGWDWSDADMDMGSGYHGKSTPTAPSKSTPDKRDIAMGHGSKTRGETITDPEVLKEVIKTDLGGRAEKDHALEDQRLENIDIIEDFSSPPYPPVTGPWWAQGLQGLSNWTTERNRKWFADNVLRAGKLGYGYGNITDENFDLEEAYQKYMADRLAGKIDAMGNPILGYGRDDDRASMTEAGTDPTPDPGDPGDPGDPTIPTDPVNLANLTQDYTDPSFANPWFYGKGTITLADGGRAGYAGGGIADLRQGYFLGKLVKKITKGAKKALKNPIIRTALLAGIGAYGLKGMGGGGWNPFSGWGMDALKKGATKTFLKDAAGGWGPGNWNPWTTTVLPAVAGGLYTAMSGDKDDEPEWLKEWKRKYQAGLTEFAPIGQPETWESIRFADGGRIGYAGGGDRYEAKIQELMAKGLSRELAEALVISELSPEAYNIIPEDKAQGGRIGYAGGGNNDEEGHRSAALSAMYGMRRRANEGGIMMASAPDPMDALNDMSMNIFKKPLNELTEEEYEMLMEINMDLVDKSMARPRMMAQEGGLMDLGGMEKDYRNEGGFVPIGGQERADDVPARLSKNEFVFTADAVRNAGGGDIDKGAEIMENLMENLEKGGKVSEESQGLEGARDMFATAQRLEGVM
jgi:hypothetical protein